MPTSPSRSTTPAATKWMPRSLTDAMKGDLTLREDGRGGQAVVNGVLGDATPVHPYARARGAREASRMTVSKEGWHDPRQRLMDPRRARNSQWRRA
jgi:hypothetical protein